MQTRLIQSIVTILLLLSTLFPQTSKMRIEGKPAKSPSEIVASRDNSGNFCAAVKVISDMDGFTYDAYNGVVKVDNQPGRDLVHLTTNERVLEVFHTGYEPLKIILSEYGIQLKEKQVWEIRITGDKKLTNIPINIITQPTGATIYIDGEKKGTGTTYQVAKGRHTLRIVKEGYRPIEKTIDVSETSTLFSNTLTEVEPVMITIKSNPTEATIYIDDVEEGQTNKQLFRFPGQYKLRISKSKYESIEKTITVRESGSNEFSYNLVKTTAILTINTTPSDAEVYLNGSRKTGTRIEVAPGRYRIEVKKSGYNSATRTITIEKGADQTQSFTLEQITGKLQLVVEPMETKVILKQGSRQVNSWTGSKYLSNIAIGNYTIELSSSGYTDQTKTITISEDKTTNVDVKMKKHASSSQLASSGNQGSGDVCRDIDGNIYKTVKIGNQVWMAENLKVTRYRNGDKIPNITDKNSWAKTKSGALCAYDNNNSNISKYGYLYNWYAVDDSRNIAPEGWHVPTDEEWQELKDYLTNNGHSGTEGTALKSTSGWNSGGNGTDDYGFAGLPAGFRNTNGTFYSIGRYAYFWSASEYSIGRAWRRYLLYSNSDVSRYHTSKEGGFSVRCVRD